MFIKAESPDWAKNAVWYQIFPDRFYNGDKTNDPTLESLIGTWPWERQDEWSLSPWTSDWYQFQPWEKENGNDFRYQFQIRRYGGDLQGVIDKLGYLEQLGINAIYFNPIFDSPSSHKYGAAYYHHIDRYFGPDPYGDTKIMESETPDDPETWQWTSADKLFLDLIQKAHHKNIRIILDGVFNHVGLTFWAFRDVIENRENSPYYSLFNIEGSELMDKSHLNDYQTLPDYLIQKDQSPLRYTGYVADLPAFRQNEGGPVEPIRSHIHQVVNRWMDPNGDGDPSDGIDGWRLDVAERVQMVFWDQFGKWVREINPEAYITGEVWWEDWWNNKQFNASPWLENGRFDAVMNYRFGDAMFRFFINQKTQISPSSLDSLLNGIISDYGYEKTLVLQNILDSHDMERLASAVVNPDRWIDHGNNVWYNREFDIRKPTANERQIQKTIITFQFVFPGAPFIYYGDEAGMWGADDPGCRKPMVWQEFIYDTEKAHFCDELDDCSGSRPVDEVFFDDDLWTHYHQLIMLRKKHKSLSRGEYLVVYTNDKTGIFAFERHHDNERILAVFNSSKNSILLNDDIFPESRSSWKQLFGTISNNLNAKDAKIFIHY
ncbi:MAG: glycoside hydrolase family 13 protein [Fidelibacterota bacterium]